MIFVILLTYIISLIVNFKKAILLWAPFRLFLLPGLLLLPEIPLYDIMSIVSLIFYLNKGNLNKDLNGFPLKRCFLLMVLSGLVLFCRDGVHVKSMIFELALPADILILFTMIKDEGDIKLLFRSLSLFVILMFGDALLQLLFDINPLSDFIDSNTSDTFYIADDSIYKEIRGVRIRSFFPHSIGFGNVCSILALVYFVIAKKYDYDMVYIIILGMLLFSVILSGSRTPFLGLFLFALGVFFNRNVALKGKFLFVGIFACIVFFYWDTITHMVMTLIDSSQDDMHGSTLEMRMEQLEGCFMVISSNIWFGIGLDFNLLDWNWILKGNESVWFDILCRRGIFGCICYSFIFIDVIFKSKGNINSILLSYLALGYLVEQSSTYNAGLNEYIYFLAFIIIFKLGVFDEQRTLQPRYRKVVALNNI